MLDIVHINKWSTDHSYWLGRSTFFLKLDVVDLAFDRGSCIMLKVSYYFYASSNYSVPYLVFSSALSKIQISFFYIYFAVLSSMFLSSLVTRYTSILFLQKQNFWCFSKNRDVCFSVLFYYVQFLSGYFSVMHFTLGNNRIFYLGLLGFECSSAPRGLVQKPMHLGNFLMKDPSLSDWMWRFRYKCCWWSLEDGFLSD